MWDLTTKQIVNFFDGFFPDKINQTNERLNESENSQKKEFSGKMSRQSYFDKGIPSEKSVNLNESRSILSHITDMIFVEEKPIQHW